MSSSTFLSGRRILAGFAFLIGICCLVAGTSAASALRIARAEWDAQKHRLRVDVRGDPGTAVTLSNAFNTRQVLQTGAIRENTRWRVRLNTPEPVPCRVLVESSQESAESDVRYAPADCAPQGGDEADTEAPTVSLTSDPPGPTYNSAQTVSINADASDNVGVTRVELYDNNALRETYTQPPYSYQWNIVATDNGPHEWSAMAYDAAGNTGTPTSTLSLTVNIEGGGGGGTSGGGSETGGGGGGPTGGGGGGPAPEVSINSTSQSSIEAGVDPYSAGPVAEEPAPNSSNSLNPAPGTGDTGYQILAINDLGMHCGDLDTRVASILPPFQVMLSQVIRKGESPELLGPSEVKVVYSAASNPNDPILSRGDAVFTGLTPGDNVYKTNFWGAVAAYDPFYPPGLLCTDPANPTTCAVGPDTGVPVPNVEELYIGPDGSVNSGDEHLVAAQHAMPGIDYPYDSVSGNDPQVMQEHYGDKPFFVNFPFGYVANDVNWFEGAGIPFSVFDDFGRENPYPLVRAQAKTPGENGQVLATVDTVLPISGEASCKNCHYPSGLEVGAPNAGTATTELAEIGIASSLDDNLGGEVPIDVSVEYATDINILRLHDLKHGQNYVDSAGTDTPCTGLAKDTPNGNENCLANKALEQGKAVVCQTCHYTPALDLAQVGPLGGVGDLADADANGRVQRVNKSNSRVMHHHHGSFGDLFPAMPAPAADGPDGLPGNHEARKGILEQTCYQCHPGTKTKCMRGAMADGGMVCQDCHGGMLQVGNDFTQLLSKDNPFDGTQPLPSKRVPWANEPGCGSCHTGDALDNLADPSNSKVAINALDGHGNPDGIRLIRAYLDSASAATTPSSDAADTTPIVPSNKRFAEPSIPASFNGFANPGAGNPKLYRVSTGHGGVFCEGCHGATHAEWDSDGPPILNDNRTAIQLQGHAGTITECSTCHTTSELSSDTQGGPHGMHLVNDIRFWKEGHKGAAKRENGQPGGGTCGACHGSDHMGTVLSRAAADRAFTVEGRVRTVDKGRPVTCDLCHSLNKSFGD